MCATSTTLLRYFKKQTCGLQNDCDKLTGLFCKQLDLTVPKNVLDSQPQTQYDSKQQTREAKGI
jgi:hypothetical protein